ncbi:hypothetical protein GCM10010392_02690 [Streptomyces clavifer]|nr:hypothetical protein GCM10010392_02690 [Streptomyces clavifer]
MPPALSRAGGAGRAGQDGGGPPRDGAGAVDVVRVETQRVTAAQRVTRARWPPGAQ